MGRDSRPPCTKKYLPYLCKRFVSTMSKASHQAATSVSVLYIVGVCLTSYVTAQAPGPPRDSWNDPAAGGTQICDGQETGDRTRVSLPRHASVADDAQMSKLDTAQMQSDRVAEPATSSTSLGTEQQSLQCLRGHVDKESQEGSNSSSTAVANVPSGPLVTLSNGMLTVDPHNTSLGEVLGAISTTAGFQLDVPPLSMDGKVFDQIGPLPLREALVQLLYGSGFNYIIQTAPQNPQKVTHLFVSSRIAGTTETAVATGPHQTADELSEDQTFGFADSTPQEQPTPAVGLPAPSPNAANVPGIPAGFNLKQAAAEAHKSPAEILDDMQKRQLEILDAQAPPPQ